MESTLTALAAKSSRLKKLANKIETLEEITELHYSLEFQQTIEALRDSIHFACRLACGEDPTSDKKYYFEHITIMADVIHYISCMESILSSSKEIEPSENVNGD
jgi:hypothetical protein